MKVMQQMDIYRLIQIYIFQKKYIFTLFGNIQIQFFNSQIILYVEIL